MLQSWIYRRLRSAGLLSLLCWIAGNGFLQAGQPKVLDLTPFSRVALLVCRMGHPDGYLHDIKPAWDYRLRVPTGKQDVWIDDETNLRAAFPDYPKQSRSRLPKSETEFYGNLTGTLTGLVRAVLEEKGKQVLAVPEIAAAWPSKPDQMALADILKHLSGQADALLLIHYLDAGHRVWDAINVARTDKGFSLLVVKLALFNPGTGQLVASREIGFNPMAIMAVDPAITGDPVLKTKLTVQEHAAKDTPFEQGFLIKERQGLFISRYTLTVLTFSRTEVEEYAWRYFRNGYAGPSKIHHFKGLSEIIQ